MATLRWRAGRLSGRVLAQRERLLGRQPVAPAPRTVVSRLREGLRPNGSDPRPHYVVCGGDSLAYRLVAELVQHDVDVTVIRRGTAQGPDVSDIRGARVITADRLDDARLKAARVTTATALALVEQDDVGNIHAALRARDLNPDLRVVIRMAHRAIGDGFSKLLGDCTILSDAEIAAPAFVATALDEVAHSKFRLRGRWLYVADRDEVSPTDVVCNLADLTDPRRPTVLPADHRRATMVLAFAQTEPRIGTVIAAQRLARSRRRRNSIAFLVRTLRLMVNRKLGIAILCALGVVAVCGTALARAQGLGLWQGGYLTLLTTVTGAQPQTDGSASGTVQALELALTVTGLTLIPLITAAVVEAIVRARLAMAAGQRVEPRAEHVVVVGVGTVGARVIRQLHELDVDVVAIDKKDQARGAALLADLDVPLLIGDAGSEETLRDASVPDCRALLVLTTDDATNLQTVVLGQALKPGLRVVLRLFDDDLAERVQGTFRNAVSRSVSYLAAPEFAAAMMEREVLKTISVGRHVLLVAEVPVRAGSPLDGALAAAAELDNEVRVIALCQPGEPGAIWHQVTRRRLAANDRLVVVARRRGLTWLLNRSVPPPPPVPPPTAPAGATGPR